VLLKFRHESDASILNTPDFFRIILGLGINVGSRSFAIHQRRSANEPRKDETSRADLHAAKQQGGSIREQRSARIKHTINGVGANPCWSGSGWQDGEEEWLVASTQKAHRFLCGGGHDRISVGSDSCSERISRSAIKNDRVDSAPWFSLARRDAARPGSRR